MATPEVDYYDLLTITPSATESEIRRAYRKTSLLYHPDKVKRTPETDAKWDLLQLVLKTLTDPEEKQKYDQSRDAKLRRKVENEALESRRRKLKEDLEAGEKSALNGNLGATNGTKRTWTQRDLDIKRIAEENRKKREAVGMRRTEEAKERAAAEDQKEPAESMDRSVKIRWIKEGEGLEIDQEFLEQAFQAGDVENVLILKDKKRRIEGREKKVIMGTGVVVFVSKSAAKQAVSKGPWDGIESVAWAAEKEAEPS